MSDNKAVEAEVLDKDAEGKPADKTIVPARYVFPETLPIVPLMTRPLFPRMMVPLSIDDGPLKELLSTVVKSSSKFVGLALAREAPGTEEHPIPRKAEDIHKVGVIAEIVQVSQAGAEGAIQVMLGILERFRIVDVVSETPYIQVLSLIHI